MITIADTIADIIDHAAKRDEYVSRLLGVVDATREDIELALAIAMRGIPAARLAAMEIRWLSDQCDRIGC